MVWKRAIVKLGFEAKMWEKKSKKQLTVFCISEGRGTTVADFILRNLLMSR